MSAIRAKTVFTLIMISIIASLSACSGSSGTKQSSVWDQRRKVQNAPSAATYKQELAEVDQGSTDIELSYQAEQVDSFVPEAADTDEPDIVQTEDPGMISVEKDILSMPSSSYTVQLFASVDIDRVYRFAEENKLSTQFVLPTVRDDIIWYVLFLDVYSGIDEAKAAAEEYSTILKTQPWVRSIGSVKKLIQ